MKYIEGTDRLQSILFPQNLDQIIDSENEIRLIDLFVESIDLVEFKLQGKTSIEGRPAYNPKDLLKLFIYGYLNQIRSSRVLEKECKRNIELMWLMKELAPDHNTISNFRRDNQKAIRKVFQYTVRIAKNFDLIGGKLLAGDSTKLRAQNSKKNNFNEKKIDRHLAYIDNKLNEYTTALAQADEDTQAVIQENIATQEQRKIGYDKLKKKLEETQESQISTSDPESRQLITRNNITEVGYSVQTVVDSKYKLPIDYKVSNENDSKAMGGMMRRAKIIVGHTNFTVLYDKGYHTGSEFKTVQNLQINAIVAIPAVSAHAPDTKYDVEKFKYDSANDTYQCPQNQVLTSNQKWYNKERTASTTQIKHYKTSACLSCEFMEKCTKNQKGRVIERSEYQDFIDKNKENFEANKELYRQRQALVEHPYGTLKRQWGFDYIITKKGKKRASADVGMMFVAYNLRRLLNIVDKNTLKEYFRSVFLLFDEICLQMSYFKPIAAFQKKYIPQFLSINC